VHRKYIPIYIQQDAALHRLFISGKCYTGFGWYFHPSLGAHTTASTASGICHTVISICRYRGRVGTGLSVLWVAYATHSYGSTSSTIAADSSNGVTNTRCCSGLHHPQHTQTGSTSSTIAADSSNCVTYTRYFR